MVASCFSSMRLKDNENEDKAATYSIFAKKSKQISPR